MINANVKKKTKVKITVFRKAIEDFELKKKIMIAAGEERETTVNNWIYRQSHSKFCQYAVILAIKEHTGWSDEDIFEPETETDE